MITYSSLTYCLNDESCFGLETSMKIMRFVDILNCIADNHRINLATENKKRTYCLKRYSLWIIL